MGRKLHFEVVPLSQVPSTSSYSERPVVLVVDDEPMVANTLTTILSQAGFDASSAYNAMDALRTARNKPPGFLLTDVRMPGMDGIELAMQVADEFPACTILLFSGNASPSDLDSARRAGYKFPLMEKPIHPAELLRYIGNCFNGARSWMDDSEFAETSLWGMLHSRAS